MSQSKIRLLKPGLLIGGCLVLGNVLAGGSEIVPTGLPEPGFSAYGLTGDGGITAIGDMLAPVFRVSSTGGFIHVDPQFYYHSNESGYSGSLGAGYRQLTEKAGILGAYVFGDYNRSTGGHNFWFVSPGIERLGNILDFSANAYISVSAQRIDTGIAFADQVGDFNEIVFTGHDQYDALVTTFTSTGYGGDAQVGMHLPFFRNSEVYVGGYYFAPKDTDTIGGGTVRLQVPVNKYLAVLVSDAYDSEYNNTFKAGLTVWFGGRSTGYDFTGDLRERLVDPIQRGLVEVASASRTLEPSLTDFENTGQTELELSNISFFVDSGAASADPAGTTPGSVGDGTYENPYVGMTQANVDDGNSQDNRNFYVNSGTYNAQYGVTDPNYIVLNNDQVYGRQNNFTRAAQGANRPLIKFTSGGFEIPDGDVSDSITGLQLVGMNAAPNAGIWIDDATNPDAQVVAVNNMSVQWFGDGIDILNNSTNALTVNIDNTLVSNNNGQGELFNDGVTGGIGAENTGNGWMLLSISGSTISRNDKSEFSADLDSAGGLAMFNEGAATVTVIDSNFSDNAVSMTDSSVSTVGGLAIFNRGIATVTVIGANFSDNSVSLIEDSGAEAASGLAIHNAQNATVAVTVIGANFSDNSISLTDNSLVATAGGLAMINGGTETMTVIGSNFSGNSVSLTDSSADIAGGLAMASSGTATVTVVGSAFLGNSLSQTGLSSITLYGGLVDLGISTGTTINVQTSVLGFNDGAGMAIDGPVSATVDRSVIAGNSEYGLYVENGAAITVTNPIYYTGTASSADGISSIVFQTANPFTVTNGSENVLCVFGNCSIIFPSFKE